MANWVELRVHGVSGTPPEEMLDSPHVVQVAGDERTRCFRPLDSAGREVRGPQGQILEAFHWGRWTSGSWTQALWMLLIPFGIVNAAQFMLPAPAGGWSRALHSLCGALLRLLGVVLTGAFTIGACVMVVDLGAWQWLLRRSFPVDDRIVLIAALLLAAAVGYALSLLGRSRRGARYRFRAASARQAKTPGGDGPDGAPGGLADMETPSFFDGDPDSPALRNLHRAAGLAIVAVLALAVAAESGNRWSVHVRWLPAWLLVTVGLVIMLLGDPEESATVTRVGTEDRFPVRDWWYGRHGTAPAPGIRGASGWTSVGLLAASAAVLLLGAVAVATTTPRRRLGLPPVTGTLPGIDGTAAWAGITGTLVVAALFVAVALLAWATTGTTEPIAAFHRFAGGMTAALAASIGFFLGLGFTAGFSLFFQGVLNRLTPHYPARILALLPADAPERIPPVKTPPVLQRVSYAWGITAGLILLLAVALGIWLAVRRSNFRRYARAAMTFGEPTTLRLPERWLARVGSAMQSARLKNQLVALIWYFAATGLVLSLAAAFAYWHNRGLVCRPAPLPSPRCSELLTGLSSAPGGPVTADDVIIGIGSLTLVVLGTALVGITRGALRAEGPRRSLNVVWDVVAFWPRAVHPYVPSPYSQDVVPALVRRICWHLGAPDPFVAGGTDPRADGAPVNPSPAETVVVAAHSQGTLISFVALLWVPPELHSRVRWLTFGSQLRQQFPRAFPHYVTVDLLRRALGTYRWLSLYRDTDAIAGPVTSWGHTHDGEGSPRSYRLADQQQHDDVIVASTGRRECGREWRLLDPVPADPALQTGAVAAIRGHGDYWAGQQDWADALASTLGFAPDVRPISWSDSEASRIPVPRPAAGEPVSEPRGPAYDVARFGTVSEQAQQVRWTRSGASAWDRSIASRAGAVAALADAFPASPSEFEDPVAAEHARQRAVGRLADAADATRRGWRPFRRSSSTRVLLLLDDAELALLEALPLGRLRQQYPQLLADVRRFSAPASPERRSFEDVVNGRVEYREPGAERTAVILAVRSARGSERADLSRRSSVDAVVATTALVLLALAGTVAVAAAAGATQLRFCFAAGGALVCPTGGSGSVGDALVVELVGMLGGAITALLSLRVRGGNWPLTSPWMFVLKLAAGALTAVVGLLVLRGQLVPGIGTLTSSAQILGWAAVLGAAQEVVTAPIDRQLGSLGLAGVGGETPGGALPDAESVAALSGELSASLSRTLRDNLRASRLGPPLIAFDGRLVVSVRPAGTRQETDGAEPLSVYRVVVTIGVGETAGGSVPLRVAGGPGVPVFRAVAESFTADISPAEREITMSGQLEETVEFTATVPTSADPPELWVNVYQTTHLLQVYRVALAERTGDGGRD